MWDGEWEVKCRCMKMGLKMWCVDGCLPRCDVKMMSEKFESCRWGTERKIC